MDFAGSKKRVVILGGGFGGAYAAKALNKILPKDWEYTLVDRNNIEIKACNGAVCGTIDLHRVR